METFKNISHHIQEGGVIAYPTETVWGLGASIFNAEAVKKIFVLKGRSFQQPLSVLVRDVEAAKKLVMLNQKEKLLLKTFWPGPYSFIFPALDKELASQLGSTDGTLCLRCSNHSVVKKMVLYMDTPIVTTSANKSGAPPAKNLSDLDWLPDDVMTVPNIDADARQALPSTILKPTGQTMSLIRRGDGSLRELSSWLKKLDYDLDVDENDY